MITNYNLQCIIKDYKKGNEVFTVIVYSLV